MAKRQNTDRHRPGDGNKDADTGISNRESARQEAEERIDHPPVGEGAPLEEDTADRIADDSAGDIAGRQTSRKAGSRSSAQKESESRSPERPMPATSKVGGAFGREPER